ncbi:hybrid sensor histidine kinase/response regulator [Vibrio mimicus]
MKRIYGIENIKSKRNSTDRLFLSGVILLLLLTLLNFVIYKELSYYKIISQRFLETIFLDKKISCIYKEVDDLDELVSRKSLLKFYMNERVQKIHKLSRVLDENSSFDQKIKGYVVRLRNIETGYQRANELLFAFLDYSESRKTSNDQAALLSDAIFNKRVFFKLDELNNDFIESVSSFNALQAERTDIIIIVNIGVVFIVTITVIFLWLQSYINSKFVIKNILDPIINNTFHLKLGRDSVEEIQDNDIEITELSSLFRAFSEANKNKNSAIESLERLNKKIKDDLDIQREFIPVVAHEFKTPLNAILGNVELILDNNSNIYENAQVLSDIKVSSEHLLSVVTSFLDYTKLDAGMYQVQKTCVNLGLFFDEIYRVIHPLAFKTDTKVSFIERGTSFPIVVETDQQMLNSVCINLIANAVRHSKGYVSIEIGIENKLLYMEISDDGNGIDMEEIENIFLPYVQLGNKNKLGTGLGLSICKKFCNLLNIDISVTSSPSGTSFKLTFSEETWFEIIDYSVLLSFYNIDYIYSKLDDKYNSDIHSSSSLVLKFKENNSVMEINHARRDIYSIISVLSQNIKINNSNTHVNDKYKILLFEDDELNIRLMERIAKNYNCEIKVLRDGEDVYSISNIDDFNIILMDLNMPKMSGIQAAEYLRSVFNDDINIYAFSANTPADPTEFCRKNGFDGFISKPLSINKLKSIFQENALTIQFNQG